MLNTLIEGSPPSIREVARYLEASVSAGASELAGSVGASERGIGEYWGGLAGEACIAALTRGREASAGLHEQAGQLARSVGALADELEAVLRTMGDVRADARSVGLRVVMTTVYPPLLLDATLAGSAAAERYGLQVRKWWAAVATATEARARWNRAIQAFSDSWTANSAALVDVTINLFDTTATAGVLANKAYALTAQRNLRLGYLASAERSLSLAVDATGRGTVPASRFYELVDNVDALNAGVASSDDLLRTGVRVGSKISKGLLILGIAGTGYSIYDDTQSGESIEQAVVSNVGGFVAGAVTGVAVGAVVGSFVLPPAGTVVGAVVGGVIGAGVGLFTSGAIDHLYESASAGFLDTVDAGFKEIGDTVDAVGDLASSAWNAVFG